MADTSNCSNYMPSAFHATVSEYPNEHTHYGQPVYLAYVEAKGLLAGHVLLLDSAEEMPGNPGVLIKYDATLPNGYELTVAATNSGWGGFYLFVEDAQGNNVFAKSNVGWNYPDDFYQLNWLQTVRLTVVRDPGVETGDYRWYLSW
jgi:hypothetical protein